MFKRDNLGSLYYETERRRYDLLLGVSDNNLSSDIIFIFDYQDVEKGETGKLINFIYGGFRDLNAIEETIKDYEKKELKVENE